MQLKVLDLDPSRRIDIGILKGVLSMDSKTKPSGPRQHCRLSICCYFGLILLESERSKTKSSEFTKYL